jgi:glutamate carboxypeptidase
MSLLSVKEFEANLDSLLALLEDFVTHETPSSDKQALDALGILVAERMHSLGAEVERIQQEKYGDHWIGRWGKGSRGILLLGHLDTVYPRGTLETMPWRRDEQYVYGPGSLDMKVSLAMALTVIERLISEERVPSRRISLLCTSDEEIGSHSSRALIEREAQEHDLVLCLEPALPDGSLKTWRKGSLVFKVEAQGRAAHAGSAINAGTNAIVEIALQIPQLLRLADDSTGTTVNIGVIRGGSRTNVVPEACMIKVDVRAKTRPEGDRVQHAVQALKPILDGAGLSIRGGWNRFPMEQDNLMDETFQRAVEIASRVGIALSNGGTGGVSDANFVANLGVPVLDGLGAIGAGAHSPGECVELGSLTGRCALLAALISAW